MSRPYFQTQLLVSLFRCDNVEPLKKFNTFSSSTEVSCGGGLSSSGEGEGVDVDVVDKGDEKGGAGGVEVETGVKVEAGVEKAMVTGTRLVGFLVSEDDCSLVVSTMTGVARGDPWIVLWIETWFVWRYGRLF